MIEFGEKRLVLAVRHPGRVVLYLRFFDRNTAHWRYRAVASRDETSGEVSDFGRFSSQNRASCDRALKALATVEAMVPRPALMDAARFLPLGKIDAELALNLSLQADFFRFFQVNALIVRRYLDAPAPPPVAFNQAVPAYNLMLALDLRDEMAAALVRDWAPLMAAVAEPGFRDDAYGHAAGAMRAVADMRERLGEAEHALQPLERSLQLAPGPARAARVVALLRRLGRSEEAGRRLRAFRERWPEAQELGRGKTVADEAAE